MAANVSDGLNIPSFMPITGTSGTKRFLARWGIVLAGGEGMRMRHMINYWLGGYRPKQYCTFVGSRSMLQHTIDRARSIVSEEHIVTIVGSGHNQFLNEFATAPVPGLVIEQPGNLGTAPGMLLPTAYVLAHNPEATVAFFPSDHFVYPEDQFCEHVRHAFEAAEKHSDKIILVGAIPDRAETEYGWIETGRDGIEGSGLRPYMPMKVIRFREKPGEDEARMLLGQGCLWNTMVIAVKAKTLWTLARQFLSEMMNDFDALLALLRAVRAGQLEARYESRALASIYANLAPADFSRDFLQHITGRTMVMPMEGVAWCDWGCPQRVVATLASLGRRPLFESEDYGFAVENINGKKERRLG